MSALERKIEKAGAIKHTMAALVPGRSAVIAGVPGTAFGERLYALGCTPGSMVTCVAVSPLGDPRAYRLKGTVIVLRKRDAAAVEVE